jgi:hypothetical protein
MPIVDALSRDSDIYGLRALNSCRVPGVRGVVVEMTEEGAGDHLDASKYAGRPIRYFGQCIPARFAETEIPVLCRIRLTRVVALDATEPGGAR